MNSQVSTSALFLAGMVFASSAFATDINKCVSASGAVTLTDEVCPGGEHTVKVISVPSSTGEESPALSARPSVEHYTLPRRPTHYATLVTTPQPARGLAPDVATLKAARANLHLFDSPAQQMRSPRLAGLQ